MTQRELLALESGLDDGALYSNFDERELTWRDGLVMIMLDFDFIQGTKVDKVLEILNKYANENEAFEALNNSEDKLSQAIANATQI